MFSEFNQKGSILLLFLITVVGIISIAAVGVYLYQKGQNPPTAQPQTLQETISSPLPISSPANTINNDFSFDSNTNYLIYTIDNNDFKPLISLQNLTPNQMFGNTPPYFDSGNKQFFVADAKNLLTYSLEGKKIKDIYKVSEPNLAISAFSISQPNAYISLLPKDYNSEPAAYIDEVNLNTGKIRRISNLKTAMYGNLSYLFKTTQNADVIGSFGGDGCGGAGIISLVTPNENKPIMKTGGGCVEDPSYISSIPSENKIILFSVVKDTWEETTGSKLDKIYSKDVYTQEEKIIYNFRDDSEKLLRYFVNLKNNKIYLIYKDKIKPLNFVTGQLDNAIPLSNNINFDENYYSYFENNILYYIKEEPVTDNFNMTLKVTDVQSGNTKEYNWGKKYPLSGQASIIGFLNNQPIISLYIYPKT